MPLGVSN